MGIEKTQQFSQARKNADKWRIRSDLENTVLNLEFLAENVVSHSKISSHNPWVFSHVPKTAGTSFDRFLASYFELKDILHINAADLLKLPEIMFAKKKPAQLISGHHPIHGLLYQLLPQQPLVHLGLIRRPFDRVVSYFNYISTRNYHAMNQRVKDMSFDDFLKDSEFTEIENGQSKRLAGFLHSNEVVSDQELYERAKNTVDNCFSLVGVTELLDDYCQFLNNKMKIKAEPLSQLNQSKRKILLKDLSSRQRKLIESKNKVDIQLYEYVRSEFIRKIR